MKKYRNNLGFTMIELLVVIAIIGILASIALISFSASQKQARDSNRKSDIKQYQNALEIFANKYNGIYPSRTDTSGATASTTLCTDLGLTSCPEDPRNDDDATQVYKYQSNGTGAGTVDATQYVLWTKLENSTDYFVACSTGNVGMAAQAGFSVTGGACPL